MAENIEIVKLRDNAIMPTYGSKEAAGADLYACISEEITISPHETVLIPTGLSMSIPNGYAGFVYARSGLAAKQGLAPANKVGVIDSDYRGEIIIALHNHSKSTRTVSPNDRVAQIVFMPYAKADFSWADELEDSERGAGGFGSTGV